MDIANFWWSSGAQTGGGIPNNSLRFRGAQHLEWTTLASQESSQYCMSVWVKRGALGGSPTQVIWSRQVTTNASQVAFGTDNQVQTNEKGTDRSSNAKYRDTAGWYHLFWKMMNNNAVNSNSQFYVNGVLLSEVNVVPVLGGNPPSTTRLWNIGRQQDNKNRYFTGYMANFQAVVNQFGTEGIAIPDVTDFGEYDDNGVWIPKEYGGAYGNQGVYLDFSDPADIGADRSGNGNDFTATGFELTNTTSPNYDWMADGPSDNFATINPLYNGASTSNANLTTANATGKPTILGIPTNVEVNGASQAWDGTEAGWTFTGNVDFGQQDFATELSTDQLPAAAIPDGRDAFRVFTSGTNIKNEVQSVFGNSSIIWIKPRDDGNSGTGTHRIITPQNGANNAVEWPSNHKLDPYVAPTSSNNVAWAWNVPDTFTGTNVLGNGYRNVSAGVSTVNYAGTGSNKSIAHGLGKKPDVVIVRMFSKNGLFFGTYCNVPAMGAGYYINLNGSANRSSSNNYFPSEPNASTFEVGTSGNVNESGQNFFALCFTSIPGFSSFGQYIGNGDNNGPFIYTGFKPALIILKRITNATSDWFMYDTARDPISNPSDHTLNCNLSSKENVGSSNENLDILSNGFKIRGTKSATNNNNHTFIYWAWAENPFGGSNVAPATAR